jgi:hypothetical protein
MPKHSKRSTTHRKKSRRHHGGNGAAAFVQAAVGSPDQQHAAITGGNVIALNASPAQNGVQLGGALLPLNPALVSSSEMLVPSTPKVVGGNQNQKKGGNLITNVAVPAMLLYANNTLGKRLSSKNRGSMRVSRKRFGSRKNRRFRM